MAAVIQFELVVTPERLQRDFPERAAAAPRFETELRLYQAMYPVDLDKIESKLGRWLAEATGSTDRRDDASRVSIVLPITEGAIAINEIGRRYASMLGANGWRGRRPIREMIASIRSDIERLDRDLRQLESYVTAYGEHSYQWHRVVEYDWPVYGSRRCRDADTPEAYLDWAAKEIRTTDGVILEAGLFRRRLPESLARTMAQRSGGGLEVLGSYDRALSAGRRDSGGTVPTAAAMPGVEGK